MRPLILASSFLFLVLSNVVSAKIIVFKDCRGSTQKEFDKKNYEEFKWTLDTDKKEASILIVYTNDFIKNSANFSKTYYDKFPIVFVDNKYVIANEKTKSGIIKLTFFLNSKEIEHSSKFEYANQEIINKSFCK